MIRRPPRSTPLSLHDALPIFGAKLRGFPGIIVMVTNPVGVLTSVMTEASELPPSRVLGTGTMLDTARLRQILGQELRIDPRSVQDRKSTRLNSSHANISYAVF